MGFRLPRRKRRENHVPADFHGNDGASPGQSDEADEPWERRFTVSDALRWRKRLIAFAEIKPSRYVSGNAGEGDAIP
jgi:hypothetical protein